jgi:acyl-CoA reductase-like NAD-dependent aldehyde dehydrogenase
LRNLGGKMSTADQIRVAELTGAARHHARWREVTPDQRDAAVAALRELAAGRADLLAQVAGLLEGFSEGQPDEPLMREASALCRHAGADPELIPQWIEEGRRRKADVLRPSFGAPRRIRPGQHPPGRAG